MCLHSHTLTLFSPLTVGMQGRGQDSGLVVDLSNKKSFVLTVILFMELWSVKSELCKSSQLSGGRTKTRRRGPDSQLFYFSLSLFIQTQFTPQVKVEDKEKQESNSKFLQFEINTSNCARNFAVRKSALVVKTESCSMQTLVESVTDYWELAHRFRVGL